jgi:DNA polymerase III subunit delta'
MSWSEIRGHESIVAGFARAAERGRLAHAYLLVGPAGIGKRLFARQLAKTLLCENQPSGKWDSCDECVACKLVEAGTHPDLFQVARPEEKHEFPIDTMLELCRDLSLKPARADRKIAILDDADDLNDESANSFLKTLEEPPPRSILILIGTNADCQLPTIHSRCQVIPFQPLDDKVVESILHASGEIDAAEIPRLTRQCGGSVSLARELADPGIWTMRSQLLAAAADPHSDLLAVMKGWKATIEQAGKDTSLQRRKVILVIRLTIESLESALTGSLSDPDDAKLQQSLRALGRDRLVEMIERCLTAIEQIERRVQLVLAAEGVADALAAAPR